MHRLRRTAAIALALLATACSDSSDRHAVPAAPLLERYALSSADSVPEGIAFDPVERAFYATSLQGGSITRIAADGTETDDEAGGQGDKADDFHLFSPKGLWLT